MTTNAIERRPAADSMVTFAVWAVIAGAVIIVVFGIPLAALEDLASPAHPWVSAFNVLNHLLLIVGVVGLARSGAAGRGRLAIAGLALTFLGLVVLTIAELATLISIDAANVLFSIATPAMALGLILAGAAVLRVNLWSGWHAFTPLALGLFIPLVMVPSLMLPGLAVHYAIGVWGMIWLLLGLSLRAEATTSVS